MERFNGWGFNSPHLHDKVPFLKKWNFFVLNEFGRIWHKFEALLFGLQNTKLNKVMEYRSYTINQKDSAEYKIAMLKLKRQWTIEPKITEEEQKAIDKFERLLNNTINS